MPASKSKSSKTQGIAEAETELSKEAVAIEKLRVQLSSQGATVDKQQVTEFAKRQKRYLDGKIELEKLKRSAGSDISEPTKTKHAAPESAKPAPEPVQKQKAHTPAGSPKIREPEKAVSEKKASTNRELAPLTESAKTQKPKTSRVKAPARAAEKSSAIDRVAVAIAAMRYPLAVCV